MSAETPEGLKRPEVPVEMKPYLIEGSDFVFDSKKIVDALESGTLDNETFAKSIGLTTVAQRLAAWEATTEEQWEKTKKLLGERMFARHLKRKDTMLAQVTARPGYTPVLDNTQVSIQSSNPEALSKDIATWLGGHSALVVDSDTKKSLNPDEVQIALNKTDHFVDGSYGSAHVELTLEYPALNHALKLTYPSKDQEQVSVGMTFYDHAYGKDKISCQTDILSVLKLLNYLKEKGHSTSCSLSQDLRPFVVQ
ncbi:MAG TPA: hypothetical protein PK109_02425 [Candidatus Paceibacterota bacterium]|nr:hypothetical protein [Candidatus Paceibacterota bacterium]